MPFGLPEFTVLEQRISKLSKNYSILTNRYDIAPTTKEKESERCPKTAFGLLTARIRQHVLDCGTDRKSQLDVFKQLINELNDGSHQDEKTAALFLLGALLHRYFRLLNECDAINAPAFNLFAFFQPANVRTCRLFTGIRKALQLSPLTPDESFRQSDLEQLDVMTISSALECFQKNMLEKNRFLNYPHFASDINFESHLQEIIDVHYRRGRAVFQQFKAIDFIHTFTVALTQEHNHIEIALDAWENILKRDQAEGAPLIAEDLESHLSGLDVIEAGLKSKLIELLHTPHILDNLSRYDVAHFIQTMKQCHSMRASYLVLGGCTLLLESRQITDKLKHCIYQVLGIGEQERALFTEQDKKDAVDTLRTLYVESESTLGSEINFDVSFFGTESLFKTAIAQMHYTLTGRILSAPAPLVS